MTRATQTVIGDLLSASLDEMPEPAVEITKKAILDDIGIGFLGYSMAGQPIVDYAKETGGGIPESTLIGDGTKVSCLVAAGANAQMAYDTDFNETGPGHHIMSSLAETAIAVAERTGASGADVIAAVAAAYELNGRLHLSLLPDAVDGGCGMRGIPASVAMTAGKLMGLDETQLNHAFGLAWYMIPMPTLGAFWHEWWNRRGMHNLAMCEHGVQSALLAEKGFAGPTNIIEHDALYDLDALVEPTSPYYYSINTLQMKPYPSSRVDHQGLQALGELIEENQIDPADIEEITFKGPGIYLEYPFNNLDPGDFWEAIYSVQWALSMVALGYEPGREWLTDERMSDPAARSMIKKVVLEIDTEAEEATVEETPTATKLVVQNIANEVEIAANGERYSRRKFIRETLGHPETPFSWDQVIAKFSAQAVPVIGEAQSAEIADRVRRLDEQDDVSGITGLFKAQ